MPDTAQAITPLQIDVVSDVVCPWCFIGKRRLEKALALKPNIPVEVRYHPYFLNPWVPREGMSRDDAYSIVQDAAMQAWEGEGGFRELLEAKEEVRERLGADLGDLFDPSYALRNVGVVFERVEELKGRLESA